MVTGPSPRTREKMHPFVPEASLERAKGTPTVHRRWKCSNMRGPREDNGSKGVMDSPFGLPARAVYSPGTCGGDTDSSSASAGWLVDFKKGHAAIKG